MPLRGERGYSMLEVLGVAALMAVVAGIAVPITSRTVGAYRTSSGMRGIYNFMSLAKMQAASSYTQARLYVNLNGNSFHVETWQKTGTPGWVTQGGIQYLAQGVAFGFGTIATPPPNTQTAITQAPACLDNNGNAIGNTACVVFNSRGIPIDATGAATGGDAIYLTDGVAVYGVTILASALMQNWQTPAQTTAWGQQ